MGASVFRRVQFSLLICIFCGNDCCAQDGSASKNGPSTTHSLAEVEGVNSRNIHWAHELEMHRLLGVSETQKASIAAARERFQRDQMELSRLQRAGYRAIDSDIFVREYINALREILTMEQRLRFEQLSFRLEISKHGLLRELTNGSLARLVQLSDEQKKALQKKANEILPVESARLRKVYENVEGQIEKELSAEQSTKMRSTIGPYFRYELITGLNRIQQFNEDVLQRSKASKAVESSNAK